MRAQHADKVDSIKAVRATAEGTEEATVTNYCENACDL